MLESLFSKVTGLQTAILFKRKLRHKSFFFEFCEISKNKLVQNSIQRSRTV